MKIIQPGKPQPPPETWWPGLIVTCSHCGCVIQIDQSDTVVQFGNAMAAIRCPTENCGTVTFTRIDQESA